MKPPPALERVFERAFRRLGLNRPAPVFSATFYPLSVYPAAIQWFVRVSPLYHATTLIRSFTLGSVGWMNLVNAAYLLVLGVGGILLARRRMAGMLLT